MRSGELLRKSCPAAHGYFSRERLVYGWLLLVFVLIFARLVWLQIIQAPSLQAKGLERRTQDEKVQAERGSIFDAFGRVMAQSVPVKEVYADPKMLTQQIAKQQWRGSKQELAQKLGSLLGQKPEDILAKLNQDASWVSLARQVDLDTAQEIMSWHVPGFGVSDKEKRVYPMGTIASSVLGIVNLEGHGVEGVEAYYDQDLFGKPGYASDDQNSGEGMPTCAQQYERTAPGNNLTLTLDSTIQYLCETQADDLMKTTRAKNVSILAMDPLSGRILAIATRPTFDPNAYSASSPDDRRNRAISMSYEPGSTFKIITGAAALEERVITPEDTFKDPGYIKIGTRTITNWDSDQQPHGWLTFTRGMELSSNVVLAQVGQKLGKDAFYAYLRAFGFGSKTGVDIAGEEAGLLVPQDKVRDIDLATMSFGQANLVTPLQLLSAISTIANGGTLYRPYIVDRVTAPDGRVVKQNIPIRVRQVISKATAAQMTQILQDVVEVGTGHLAAIPGIAVAGKTGTAQKVDPQTGQYSRTDFVASFAAFAPAQDPKIALLIVVDSPQGEVHQGGTLAAPRARAIIEGALQYYGIPVAKDTPSDVGSSAEDTPQHLVRLTPAPAVPERQPLNGEVVVPNLVGLTMRQAGEVLAKLELHFDFTGTGLVTGQTPAPGKVVARGSTVEARFAPLGQSP